MTRSSSSPFPSFWKRVQFGVTPIVVQLSFRSAKGRRIKPPVRQFFFKLALNLSLLRDRNEMGVGGVRGEGGRVGLDVI